MSNTDTPIAIAAPPSANSLREVVGRLRGEAERQSGLIAAMLTGVLQVDYSIRSVADAVGEVRTLAADARQFAGDGATAVRQCSEVITGIGHVVEGMQKALDIVADIARQINILSLNAAIEAARAGDSGAAFSVVATEVRRLANRTTAQSQEIRQLLESSSAELSQGVARSHDADQALTRILERVDSTAASIDAIATSTREQTEMVATVSAQVQEVAGTTESCNAAVTQIHDGLRATGAPARAAGSSDTDATTKDNARGLWARVWRWMFPLRRAA